jgi:hypothetical protein
MSFVLMKPTWHCFSNETSPLVFCPSRLTRIHAVRCESHIYLLLYEFNFAYANLFYTFVYHMNSGIN